MAEPEHSWAEGGHCRRADAWLDRGFGDRLTANELLSIRRVLFARAWQAKLEMQRAKEPAEAGSRTTDKQETSS